MKGLLGLAAARGLLWPAHKPWSWHFIGVPQSAVEGNKVPGCIGQAQTSQVKGRGPGTVGTSHGLPLSRCSRGH